MHLSYYYLLANYLRFIANLPGPDFVRCFLRRHKDLSVRTANLIKRSRAALSQEIVKDFFDHYEKTVAGIPASHIFNYDETNFRDNPGSSKAIFQKGVKYAEQVRDHTKSAISVMFCGSAEGVLLPPTVVYKAANVYESWCSGGIEGALYYSTDSGWFDMFVFALWFKQSFLPHVRRMPGRKVLLGDNLASHISLEVIELCKKHNIEFICLPPNSTDKLQPLDVGFFGPMKYAWKRLLREELEKDPTAKVLAKPEFPRMLKELVMELKPAEHLPKAFEKTGLFPVNRQKVLERIPSVLDSAAIASNIDQALLKKLEVRRFGSGTKKPRGKKVPAGRSYTKESSEEDNVSEEEDNVEEVNVDRAEQDKENSEEEDSSGGEELPDVEAPCTSTGGFTGRPTSPTSPIPAAAKKDCFVVVVYEGQWFLAEVCKDQDSVSCTYTRLSYMTIKGNNNFAWGDKKDEHVALDEDIIMGPVDPVPVNSRGHLGLSKKDLKFVLSRMVMVYLPSEILLGFYYYS